MSRIIIIAKGTYGDVFPMYSIAQGLKDRGHAVIFATQGKHAVVARSLGHAVILLDQDSTEGPGNRPWSDIGVKYLKNPFPSLEVLFPSARTMQRETTTLLDAAQGTDLVIGNQLALSGPLVAKKLDKKWVYCAISPLALFSRCDPPLLPYLHGLQRLSIDAPESQRPYLSLARGVSRLLLSPVYAQRDLLGISDARHPLFEGMHSTALNLMLTSPALIDKPRDWPTPALITGFTWFEAEFMKNSEKMQRLEKFLNSGSPPVVFALGGDARTSPGRFFRESIKACEQLGIRAIIVSAERFHAGLPKSSDILITGYLPYSILFRGVLAVVHSGGIGTIGWCLRYGIPSLLVPGCIDQFDNAYRASKKGLVDILPRRKYRAPALAIALDKLVNNGQRKILLDDLAHKVASEDGGRLACDSIERLLR